MMSCHRCFLSTYYVRMLGMKERGQTAHILMEHSAQAPRMRPESSLSSHSRSESRLEGAPECVQEVCAPECVQEDQEWVPSGQWGGPHCEVPSEQPTVGNASPVDTGEEHSGRGQAARLGFRGERGCSRKRHIVGLLSPKCPPLITEEDFGFGLTPTLGSSSLVQSARVTKPQEAAASRGSSR